MISSFKVLPVRGYDYSYVYVCVLEGNIVQPPAGGSNRGPTAVHLWGGEGGAYGKPERMRTMWPLGAFFTQSLPFSPPCVWVSLCRRNFFQSQMSKFSFFKSRSLALTPEMCSFDVSSDVFHVILCGINIRDDIIKWSLWSPVLCFTE